MMPRRRGRESKAFCRRPQDRIEYALGIVEADLRAVAAGRPEEQARGYALLDTGGQREGIAIECES
jgi:hypothetical protein